MNHIIEQIIDIIYPRRCPLCGKIITKKQGLACEVCYKELRYIEEPRCKCCSKQLNQEEKEYCYDCSRKEFSYDSGIALWNYTSVLKKSISDFKYHNRKEYSKFYGQEAIKSCGELLRELQLDALIPVPVHWTRYIERGYNQAEVIANEIGKPLSIPVMGNILVRRKKTIAQKKLNNKEREKNLQGAFAISKENKEFVKQLRRVMIVDDIYTTGSTINTCAKILKQEGVEEVYFLVLCIGSGY